MNTLAKIHSLVEVRLRSLAEDQTWDPQLHPRVPSGNSKGGEFTSKGKVFSPISSGELTQEERDRYRDLESKIDELTPEEKEEYERLHNKAVEWVRSKEAEGKANEKKYRDRLKHDAETVAKALDFDTENIIYTDETLGFTLNDKHLVAGGHVDHGGDKVYIHVNDLRASNLDQYAGLVAHEIEHAKFNYFLKAYKEDRKLMDKEPRPEPDPNHRYYWGRRGGIDAIMTPEGDLRPPYDEKFPIYNLYQKVFYLSGAFSNLIKGDGVTNYSVEYWKAWTANKTTTEHAVHETLAEMSKIKYMTGKLPEYKDYYGFRSIDWRMKNAHHFGFTPPENPLDIPKVTKKDQQEGMMAWRNLYRAIDKIWNERKK